MKERRRSKHFDRATYAWKPDVDYRHQPERYKVGKGEQGVLICEPYKSELTPHWRFSFGMFEAYLKAEDFVGADMAPKFLQMGYTRARRYANYKGGKKYGERDELNERGTGDPEKAASAGIFYERWKQAEAEPRYAARKAEWKARHG